MTFFCHYFDNVINLIMVITAQQADKIILLLESIDAKLGNGMKVVRPTKSQKKELVPAKSLKETLRTQFLKKYSNG
jgi:hypothetical protein